MKLWLLWCISFQGQHKNVAEMDGLKQRKFILSQFWRPEVWNQSVYRAVIYPKALAENPSLPLPACSGPKCSLVCGSITPVSASVFTGLLPSVSVSLCVLSFSNKDPKHIRLKAHPNIWFRIYFLGYPCQDLLSLGHPSRDIYQVIKTEAQGKGLDWRNKL